MRRFFHSGQVGGDKLARTIRTSVFAGSKHRAVRRNETRPRLLFTPKETIPNAPRTCNRLCWRKCQRFVIVSPWCTQFHLAVSVNMITGIKHRRPRHPRELQLTAELHGVISQLYRSHPRLHPLPGYLPLVIVIVHLSRAKCKTAHRKTDLPMTRLIISAFSPAKITGDGGLGW